jgi:hypothetical protein
LREEPHPNVSWSEQYRIAAKDWVDKESAASILEETKSAILSQKMLEHWELPVSRAEMQVKGSDEWREFLSKMVRARESANMAKVKVEYVKMKFQEWNSHEATKRAEMKI